MLKWPNDLLVRSGSGWAKLCGILIEIVTGPDAVAQAVIGIGINVRLGAARQRIDQAATDLAALGVTRSRNQVLATILEELLAMLRDFERAGFATMAADWNARHAFQGRQVVGAGAQSATVEGTALGADEDGALLVGTRAGPVRIVSGEVSLRLLP
jgi:BirA family biotin operon repressor/biotin-[acetyl-CoA-carboxylase] ligase